MSSGWLVVGESFRGGFHYWWKSPTLILVAENEDLRIRAVDLPNVQLQTSQKA
jgi:hypothetical protein